MANLFANLDEFNQSGGNYSFGELDGSNDDIIELPDEVISPPTTKLRTRKNKGKNRPTLVEDVYFSDSADKEDTVSPGMGQKTAFKKLSQIKKSLATTAVTEPTSKRSRTAMTTAIREAYQQKRTKRSLVAETTQIRFAHTPAVLQPNIVNDSFDDEELSVYIKIKWEGTSKIEKIQFSMYKTFKELINQLSARDSVDAKSFLLMFGNNVIKHDDSPHSIGYTLGKFISVRVVDNPNLYIGDSTAGSSRSNTIEVKIQLPQWKKPMICNIALTDQFKVLTGMCAEKLQCHPNKLRFKLDGDILENSSTPDEHDFEGGEILDLIMTD